MPIPASSGASLSPDGYACDFKDEKFNLAQVPRVESYRGFIFGRLNPDAPSLIDYLGPVSRPIDEWLDRHPGGKVVLAEANRLKYKGNWKLAYDNSADGYHVIFSHRSLLDMENRFAAADDKGMSFYQGKPDAAPMYVQYLGHGHHFKDKRPNVEQRPGALSEIEGVHPGMEHYEDELRRRLGAKADRALDLAASEPVNINVFQNLLILGNHIQVIEPLAVDETNTTWYGTAVVDEAGELDGAVDAVNALRMRTEESFSEFRRTRRSRQFRGHPARAAGAGGRVGLYASRARRSRPRPRRREWRCDGAGDRRGVHARVHEGMEAADDAPAEAGCETGTVSSSMRTNPDPSRSSYYVNDAFYRELVDGFSDWTRDERAVADPALREACRMVLEREARLLDQCRFEEWLRLYARECLYWVPATPGGGDPRRGVCICFDDRRRLEDRIFRLQTGYAWSQVPPSRTVHMISNVEVFATERQPTYMVRSNLLVTESALARPARSPVGAAIV